MTEKSNTEEKFEKPYHFADEGDKVSGIETAIYANGNHVKRFNLSTGQQAIVRELSGRDMMDIDKQIAANAKMSEIEELYMVTLFHFAVKIDGKQIPIEDFEKMRGKDYNKIKIAVQSINF